MVTALAVQKKLYREANEKKAKILAGFFKTGPGEYAAGDKFLGVIVPKIRKIAKEHYSDINLKEIEKLIHSPFHEERLTGLIILTYQFPLATATEQKQIFNLYLENLKYINNWDLVDLTADRIVGEYLKDKNKKILFRLASSPELWSRRVAILATFCYIKNQDPKWTLLIAKKLLNDQHDLIHKAVGWMLREIGKRCGEKIEEDFLKKHFHIMPRTTLRYAIERFSPKKKMYYMKKPS